MTKYAILLVLLLAGCQFIQDDTEIPDQKIFEGTDGLVLSFFDGAPSDTLYPGAAYQVGVLIENKGATSINCKVSDTNHGCGQFLVFAKEPLNLSITDGLKTALGNDSLLHGKESYLSGGKAALEVTKNEGGSLLSVAPTAEDTTVSVFATACYPYETKLSTTICIDTAPFILEEESRNCNLDDISFSDQGAPVAIKKIEQYRFIDQSGLVIPSLRIFMENKGEGVVLSGDASALKVACTSDEVFDEELLGRVVVKSASVSDIPMDCADKAVFLTGKNRKNFIDCKATSGFDRTKYSNNFVATFDIVLSYGYQTTISKEVNIIVNSVLSTPLSPATPDLPAFAPIKKFDPSIEGDTPDLPAVAPIVEHDVSREG